MEDALSRRQPLGELGSLWGLPIEVEDPFECPSKGAIHVLVAVGHVLKPSLDASQDAVLGNII